MFLVFALGFASASFLVERILLENAKDEVALKAKIMMEAARSMRSYTVEEIRNRKHEPPAQNLPGIFLQGSGTKSD
jgi:hypothetical protein